MHQFKSTNHRWVIQDVDLSSVRLAKSLAAEHGVRIRTILEVAIERFAVSAHDLSEFLLDWEANHD